MNNIIKKIILNSLLIYSVTSCINSGNLLPISTAVKPQDINDPGAGGLITNPEALFVANFDGKDAIFELKSSSMTKHTVLPDHTYLNSAVKIDKKIYYSLESISHNVLGVSEVYELDLITGISKKISQFHQDLTFGVSSITKAGKTLYASARTNSSGYELHKYTNNQWQLIKDIEVGIVGSFPAMFLELNDQSHFLAYQAASGMELWSTNSDGSLHANLYAGKASSHVMPWFVKDNQIIATSKNANSTSYDLYAINDQGQASKIISAASSASAGANPLSVYPYKSGVVANCHHDSSGRELCSSSTLSGQWTVIDINVGSKSSNPKFFTIFKDEVYFQAEGAFGIELYKFDGQVHSLVQDIQSGVASSYPENLMVINGKLYFSANGAQGQGMYSFDGTNLVRVTLQQKDLKFARSLLNPSR
jgi:ELWxxDGT repeat protein